MQFYKVRCVVDDSEIFQSERRLGRYRISKKLADVVARSKIYNQENRKERYVFLYMASENTGEMVFGLIVKDEEDPTKIMKDFFSYVGLKHKNAVGTENTLCDTLGMLRRADNDYDYEMYEALSDFSITVFDSFRNGFSEYLFDVWKDEDNYKRAGEISVKTSLREELDRIAMGKKKKRATGIPCTYVIETDDRTLGEVASQCIMRALYNHGRIRSRRFTVLRLDTDHLSRRIIEKVYFSSGKGTVVIDARSNDVNESEFDTGLRGALLAICEVMNRFDNVQTVFIFGRECKNIKDEIISELENETLVEIVEDYYDVEASKMHLAALASKDGLSGEIKLDVIHDEDDYSKGTVRIEIPLYFYVNKFFTYFNAAVPNYYNSIPGGYVIQIKYEIDDLGAITFNPQGIDDGLDKFISGIKLNFDEEEQMLTLDLGTTFGEGWLSDLLNGLLKGFFQIVFEKEV